MNHLLNDIQTVDIDSVYCHPDNPRIGNVQAIKASLKANKQFAPLLVQTSTNYILAGNHTWQAAHELGWKEIAVAFLDVSDSHAKRIMLAANRIADLGEYDERLLTRLLNDVLNDDEALLESTGYSPEEVDSLLSASVAYEPDLEEVDEESALAASAFLDRIMPSEEDEEESIDIEEFDNESPVEVIEFVIFRFGEFRAKVPRAHYDSWAKNLLKEINDPYEAGMSLVVKLGIDPSWAYPALPSSNEHWS